MTGKQPPGLFITGTNTGVGKTWAAACIARTLASSGWRVGVYKPAASGCREVSAAAPGKQPVLVSEDAETLWEAAGRPGKLEAVCPQRFRAPLAPHLAARADGQPFDARRLRTGLDFWRECSDIVLVEGAGGLLSPLGDDEYVADLAKVFGFPLVVVAPNEIGVIHQVLQTLWTAATFRGGLPLAGVVLNRPRHVSPQVDPSLLNNREELAARSPAPVLCELGWQDQTSSATVPWYDLACQVTSARDRSRAVAALFA